MAPNGPTEAEIAHDLHASMHDTETDNARFLQAQIALAREERDNTGAGATVAAPAPGSVPPPAPVAGQGISRKGDTVTVTSRALVMEVLKNTGGDYSVHGYNERASQCIGAIYLGLDAGAQYDAEATAVNAAIETISAEAGFATALELGRGALGQGQTPGTALGTVLTGTCNAWFGIPDGTHVVPGGVRLDVDPPPRCPGDYNFPSAFIFYPNPPSTLSAIAKGQGLHLRAAATAYVTQVRASGAPPNGPLAQAVFANCEGDDDLTARTLIGVMMGMIPTVLINMGTVLKTWESNDNAKYKELALALHAHGGPTSYERARSVLTAPMVQAIQPTPQPPAVWRTAVRDHTLGGMAVKTGDKIIVSIMGACHEDLAAGRVDLSPMFGGDRSEADPPLHACPGFPAAMGFMLGFINAVLEPQPATT